MAKPGAKKLFEKFRIECVAIRRDYNTFCALYESGNRADRIMRATAPAFFRDLNDILIRHLYQRICAITDPARTRSRENLTTNLIEQRLLEKGLLSVEIKRCSAKLMRYRSRIKKARDKLVSHIDVIHTLRKAPVGVHKAQDVIAFFEALQNYCDAVGRAVGTGPLDFRAVPEDGGVEFLLRALDSPAKGGGLRG